MSDHEKSATPWWSKSAWQLGPLAIGFLMLLAGVLGWVPSALDNRGKTADVLASERMEKMLTEHVAQSEATNRLLRAICRHTAKNDSLKEDCDR